MDYLLSLCLEVSVFEWQAFLFFKKAITCFLVTITKLLTQQGDRTPYSPAAVRSPINGEISMYSDTLTM